MYNQKQIRVARNVVASLLEPHAPLASSSCRVNFKLVFIPPVQLKHSYLIALFMFYLKHHSSSFGSDVHHVFQQSTEMGILYILAKIRPCTVIHIPSSPWGFLFTYGFSYYFLFHFQKQAYAQCQRWKDTVFSLSKLRQMRHLLESYSNFFCFCVLCLN